MEPAAVPVVTSGSLRGPVQALLDCPDVSGSAAWLEAVTAVALLADCGTCWAYPEDPCAIEDGGTHLARFRRVRRSGLIGDGDLDDVISLAGERGIVPAA